MTEPAFPKLRVSPSEAKAKIAKQLRRGREIQQSAREAWRPPHSAVHVAQVEADREKWAKHIIRLLKSSFTDQSIAIEFSDWHYSLPRFALPAQHFNKWIEDRIVQLESIKERIDLFPTVESETKAPGVPAVLLSKDVFLVHGHDGGAKSEVARFLEKLALYPIILHEKPSKGQTIIEKVEAHSNVGFAVVLLTPDDIGYRKGKSSKKKNRARQNVVLELGYFLGKLGRTRVAALLKGTVELPSDFTGVLYISMDRRGAWRTELANEIKEAGIAVNMDNLT